MLTFNPQLHEYRISGVVVPSVTAITAPLMDFSGIPKDVLERKRQIGTALHRCIELILDDDLDADSVDGLVAPYLKAFQKWRSESGFVTDECEKRVHSTMLKYAGTLDLNGWTVKDKRAVVDFKSTYALSTVTGIQTAGYAIASIEMGDKIAERYSLHLKPDGTYNFVQHKDRMELEHFKTLLNFYRIKEKYYGK
jgi:hypothetical protein